MVAKKTPNKEKDARKEDAKKTPNKEKESKDADGGVAKKTGSSSFWKILLVLAVLVIIVVEALRQFEVFDTINFAKERFEAFRGAATSCEDLSCYTELGAGYVRNDAVTSGSKQECCRPKTCFDISCPTGYSTSPTSTGYTQASCCAKDTVGGGGHNGVGPGQVPPPSSPIIGPGDNVGGGGFIPIDDGSVNGGGTIGNDIYTYIGDAACTQYQNIPEQSCRENSQCTAIGQQTNGCWHLFSGETPSFEQQTYYTKFVKKSEFGTSCEAVICASGKQKKQGASGSTSEACCEPIPQRVCSVRAYGFKCIQQGKRNKGWKYDNISQYNNYKACVQGGGLPDPEKCVGRSAPSV